MQIRSWGADLSVVVLLRLRVVGVAWLVGFQVLLKEKGDVDDNYSELSFLTA